MTTREILCWTTHRTGRATIQAAHTVPEYTCFNIPQPHGAIVAGGGQQAILLMYIQPQHGIAMPAPPLRLKQLPGDFCALKRLGHRPFGKQWCEGGVG
jgi:hypothetical protein